MNFIFALLLLFSVNVFAQSNAINLDGLTESQLTELKANVAKMQQNAPIEAVKENLESAQSIGAAVGRGLVATAKELGLAVNDFSHTGIGKIAIFIIVFKLVGKELIHYLLGLLWFVTFVPCWWGLYKRQVLAHIQPGGKTSADVDAMTSIMWIALVAGIACGFFVTFSG